MTKRKAFKQRVRNRQQKTGEKYTTARRHTLQQKNKSLPWDKLAPIEQAQHPDTPPDKLMGLAIECPAEVLGNPALQQKSESEPPYQEAHTRALMSLAQDFTNKNLARVSCVVRCLWACDCVARQVQNDVSPLRPSYDEILQTIRLFLQGRSSHAEFKRVYKEAGVLPDKEEVGWDDEEALYTGSFLTQAVIQVAEATMITSWLLAKENIVFSNPENHVTISASNATGRIMHVVNEASIQQLLSSNPGASYREQAQVGFFARALEVRWQANYLEKLMAEYK
jgi:hypothetical protein